MKRQIGPFLAGTAISLLMASAPAASVAFAAPTLPLKSTVERAPDSLILAQAKEGDDEEGKKKKKKEKGEDGEPAAKAEKPVDEQPAAEEPAVEKAVPDAEKVEEQPAEEPAVAEEPKAEEPPVEKPAVEEEPAAEPKADEPAAEEKPAEEPQAEEAPAEEPAVKEEPAEEPKAEEKPAEEPRAEEAPAEEPAVEEEPAEEPKAEEQPAEEPKADVATDPDAPAKEESPDAGLADDPDAPTAEEPAKEEATDDAERAAEPTADTATTDEEQRGKPKIEQPVLDSQKDEAADDDGAAKQETAEEEAAPAPKSDEEAQQKVEPEEIESVEAEEGKRVDEAEADELRRERRRERREGADRVEEIGDRVVIQFNNQIVVESSDRDRLRRGAEDYYVEELRDGRTREVIVRSNGVRVVTIRNRYGDVLRRSRITPDGREYVLVYVRDDDYGSIREFRDPGRDLPPMRLTIPVDEYILDARVVEDPDRYYTFLDQPPVERVERLYSIDEVRYSARIRDKVRRVDLDTITFEFGSAAVEESEVAKLEGVAVAMERMLEENPAETFLIEGHTDAVGSNVANLALSDERAESVAEALTKVFGIPPENLVTQGYGEQYLKIDTEERERENRRVAIRRITPLVAPVASAK
ncbi:MAG: OmpA family protein [Brucellaceae bacterium]|nr:OmpA family protein [Brucellaceae bacterium]